MEKKSAFLTVFDQVWSFLKPYSFPLVICTKNARHKIFSKTVTKNPGLSLQKLRRKSWIFSKGVFFLNFFVKNHKKISSRPKRQTDNPHQHPQHKFTKRHTQKREKRMKRRKEKNFSHMWISISAFNNTHSYTHVSAENMPLCVQNLHICMFSGIIIISWKICPSFSLSWIFFGYIVADASSPSHLFSCNATFSDALLFHAIRR